MKYIAWDPAKNETLKTDRGVSFEDAVIALIEKGPLGVFDHPNQEKYKGQKILIIEIGEYAYVLPYVEDKEKLFFKTLFPSRKFTKELIEKGGK